MNYRDLSHRIGFQSLDTAQRKLTLLQIHGNACKYCGADGTFLIMEHVLPTSRGGNNGLNNMVPACVPCNIEKSGYLPDEIRDRSGSELADRVEAVMVELAGEVRQLHNTPIHASELDYDALQCYIQTSALGQILESYRLARIISKNRIRRELGLGGWTWDRWITGQKLINPTNLQRVKTFLGIPDAEIDELYARLRKAAFRRRPRGKLYNKVDRTDIFQEITDLRIDKYLSQTKLAARIGICNNQISQLERGIYRNKPFWFDAYCEYLGVPETLKTKFQWKDTQNE